MYLLQVLSTPYCVLDALRATLGGAAALARSARSRWWPACFEYLRGCHTEPLHGRRRLSLIRQLIRKVRDEGRMARGMGDGHVPPERAAFTQRLAQLRDRAPLIERVETFVHDCP